MLRIRALTPSLNVQSIQANLFAWYCLFDYRYKRTLVVILLKKLPHLHFLNLFFSNLFSIFLQAKCSLLFNMLFSFIFSSRNKTVLIAKLIRETKPKLTDMHVHSVWESSSKTNKSQMRLLYAENKCSTFVFTSGPPKRNIMHMYRACSSLQF